MSLQSHGCTDKAWMKAYVFVAWALDTVHQIILLRTGYITLVATIDNLGVLPDMEMKMVRVSERLFDSYQS